MKSRLLRLATAIYPPAWRERYGEEMSHLCDELVAAGEGKPFWLACAMLPQAFLERARALHPRVLIVSAATAVVLVAGTTAVLSDGFGLAASEHVSGHWLEPHSSVDSRLVTLTHGAAQASTTMHEAGGYVLLARVSAPRGARVEVYATQLLPPPNHFSAVFSTFPLARNDVLLSCRSHSGVRTCTQGGLWGCPLEASSWRLRIVKEGGPAGPVQVDFLVGRRPLNLSTSQTDSWVARFDTSWRPARASS